MATNKSVKDILSSREKVCETLGVEGSFEVMINDEINRRIFERILKDKASDFIASIIKLYNSDENFKGCEESFINNCVLAATLGIPIDNDLGYVYIVPHKGQAILELGCRGYVEVALKSGSFKELKVMEVHEGELVKWNPLTEELVVKPENKKSNHIIGYGAYLENLVGYKTADYWTAEEIYRYRESHPEKDYLWKKYYDGMAKKLVISKLISEYTMLCPYVEEKLN